jgi:hypothetical protein
MVESDDDVKTPNYTDFTVLLRGNDWCCQTGLNCRPLHYQWSALPLSYGSMPGWRIGQKAPTGGPILATRPRPAQARERPAGRRKIGKVSAVGLPPCSSGRFWADPVPEFAGGPAGDGFSPIEGPVISSSGAADKSGSMMTNDRDGREGRAGHLAKKDARKDARRDRLKDALRENLKRRKSQARGRNDIAPASSHDEAAAPHDDGGEKPGE